MNLNLNPGKPPAAATATPTPPPAVAPPAPPAPVVTGASESLAPEANVESGAETQTQTGESTPAADIQAEAAALAAVDRGGVRGEQEGATIYTSHPIRNFRLGRFQFENATLRLDSKDKEDFEKLLNHPDLPAQDRNVVRTLDIGRVDEIVEQRRRAGIQGSFDSSVGRDALEKLHAESPTIGREDITHELTPQSDQNMPKIPQPVVDSEGKTGLDQGAHVSSDAAVQTQ